MLTVNEFMKGNKYIISENNIQIGIYAYMGIKSALNDNSKMTRFIMFMKYGDDLNKECIEGYELFQDILVESSITIQNYEG